MIGLSLISSLDYPLPIAQRRRGGGGRSKWSRERHHHPKADGEVSAKGGILPPS